MSWLNFRRLRERRVGAREDRRKRSNRKRKSLRPTLLHPTTITLVAFTVFLMAQLRARARRFTSSQIRLRSPVSAPVAAHTPVKQTKQHIPTNWHAAAAKHASLVRGMSPKIEVHRDLVQYHTVALGGSGEATETKRSIVATQEMWDRLPMQAQLPSLHNTTFPWQHVARRAANAMIAPPLDRAGSIFAALRKGPWMGCSRANALVCTGVYRSLKRSAASSVFDVNCARHLGWLPKVVDKLMSEYRLVRVVCALSTDAQIPLARSAWDGHRYVRFVRFNGASANTSSFPDADATLAREVLHENLISAMRFLKLLKQAGRSRYLIHENYPSEHINLPTAQGLRLNAALPPFSLPPPLYVQADPDDVHGTQIACRSIAEMFEVRSTPTMDELVDPRKRRVLE